MATNKAIQKQIRNFCIIAHIDHGKSTLADRLLEVTHTVTKREMKEQLLDQMDIERERGITIKLQPVRMEYEAPGTPGRFILNLIDTPGHVDFSYEVSRSLAACEGAILVVDSTQGIEAQTLANAYLAVEHGLTIIPVVNKIDLPNSDREKTAAELIAVFGFKEEEILYASGKTGEGVEAILQAVIDRIEPPQGDANAPTRALIFDSMYDMHRGVITYVRVIDGSLSSRGKLFMLGSQSNAESIEVGFFKPQKEKSDSLETGEVGYIVTGLREVGKARVGDTVTLFSERQIAEPLPGYKHVVPMVYASIFPVSGDDYPMLRDAMEKLKLNDAALEFEPENIPSIGFGFRTGFLGLLHMDIVQERLTREYNLDLVLTAPSVAYEIITTNGEVKKVHTPAQFPDPSTIKEIQEPWINVALLTPSKYIGSIMEIVTQRRGLSKDIKYIGDDRVEMTFEMPLANIIIDFYDKLKSVSSGYASMNYELIGLRAGDLVKVDILVAGEKVEALAAIMHKTTAEADGRELVAKLKTLIPKQQFEIAIQAAIGAKIIARESISALRKDVTTGLYGGDVTRKMKVLEKQKKGKKRMKKIGKVDIPQEAFLAVLKK
ncbi:MAG TPA: translation elongation factor 4 [Patescibacteria group bacterium]|jgi:GTP-binding protein LepA|nr:translation elongation factor 4 [Patescibacteria group bacterium]